MKNYIKIRQFLSLFALPLAFLIVSCGSGSKTAGDSPEYLALVERVNDMELEIENTWANPMRGSRINLHGNSNYLRINGEQADIFLPYFGVRHSGGGYGSEGGIRYEGQMEDLRIEKNPREEEIEIYFSGDQKAENFDFHITIYPNGKTTTSVSTSQRDRITYDGRLQE